MRASRGRTVWTVALALALLGGVLAAQEAGGSAPEADGAGAESRGTEHPDTYLEFAIAGGPLMVPIAVCSLFWATFLLERLIALRRRRILPPAFVRAVGEIPRGRLERGRVEELCTEHPSCAARILRTASAHLDEPRNEIEHAVGNAAQREIHGMRRYLRLFAVVASVAPLLGLLGTVTGMVQAFRTVAEQGLGSGKYLAPGIYQALITTVAGLIVAIPALLTYYWLSARIENYVHAIDTLVVDFVEAHRLRPSGDEDREALALEAREP